jgi:hypothetical protein
MSNADNGLDTRALGEAMTAVLDAPARMAATLAGSLARAGSPGCAIPPPCWEPRPAGRCTLVLPPGCTGTIRIHLYNCDWTRRLVGVTAPGKLAAWTTFDPTTQVVDPQSRVTFTVRVRVPDDAKPGQSLAGPILVRGCVDYFIRVDVVVAEEGGRSLCEVSIEDCPDHIHHWYDHFYCPRPCRRSPKEVREEVRDG